MILLEARSLLLSIPLGLLACGSAAAQDPPPAGEPQVQARGPVHEAFARPNVMPKESPVVPKEPPAPIRELPPLQKPDLAGVQWVPGYWAYDGETKDFMWISGTWRVPPPDRQWVPGNWSKVDGGWQWQSGFWGPTDPGGVKPLDSMPPGSLEVGPSSPPPNDDSFYTPGQWVFQDGEWVWQPGTWVQNQGDMVYNPPAYLPNQNGSLYVPGYWDYPLQNRGMLFAPVAFGGSPWIGNPGWFYRPGYSVGLSGLLGSLFIGANSGNYYFGNYYGNNYRAAGYLPWTNYSRRGYDPLLNYYAWSNRGTTGWNNGLNGLYNGRLNGTLPAPATTYASQLRANPNLAAGIVSANSAGFARNIHVNPVNSLQTVHALGNGQNHHVRLTNATAGDLAARQNFVTRQSFAAPNHRLNTAPAIVRAGGVSPSFAPALPTIRAQGPSFHPSTATRSHMANPIVQQPVVRSHMASPVVPRTTFAPQMHAAPRIVHSAPLMRSAPIHRAAPAMHGGGHVGGGHGGGHRR
jgi:hypothetical protein